MTNQYLFIYGTLLQSDNEFAIYLRKHSIFHSKGKFKGKLFDIGEYPGAIEENDSEYYVQGSIVSLSDRSVLKHTDVYEGYNSNKSTSNLYNRKLVPIETDNGIIQCWIYLYNQPINGLTQITSGDYLQYIKQKKSPGL